jgi:hypothetical protein
LTASAAQEIDMNHIGPLRGSMGAALLWLAAVALAMPARADDVVYPPGSRVGLVPPPGLSAAAAFPGFEDRARNVAMLVGALPADAYGEFERSDSAEGLKRLGATLEKRETLSLPTGQALLVIGHQDKLATWMLIASAPELTAMVTIRIPDAAKDAYPDRVLRAALQSLAVRAEVPVEEQLGLLPFRVATLADFKIGAVLPGRGIMLTDAAPDAAVKETAPHLIVAVLPGEPTGAGDRNDLAREIFRGIPNLKDVHITNAESLRIGGQQGHEIMATAKDAASGTDLTVVQWLRFGGGAYLQLVGIAPTSAWTQAYGRFRSVRDGIEPR